FRAQTELMHQVVQQAVDIGLANPVYQLVAQNRLDVQAEAGALLLLASVVGLRLHVDPDRLADRGGFRWRRPHYLRGIRASRRGLLHAGGKLARLPQPGGRVLTDAVTVLPTCDTQSQPPSLPPARLDPEA